MIGQFLTWYFVIQLLALAALPLTLRLCTNLPDRGYALNKALGLLLVALLLWLGYSYGFMYNSSGGAWLAAALFAVCSFFAGRQQVRNVLVDRRLPVAWRYNFMVELLFLAGFAAWAYVRAHDPSANHTEQPMDLMFMNSIWGSETYPPRDAWLSGYSISYYYLGYWLLVLLSKLTGLAPEIAYNVGQASWFGLLLIGSFGVVYNLLAWRGSPADQGRERPAMLGGLLGALFVAVSGNLQTFVEWLYANGIDLAALNAWTDVHNFPENASQTGQWYIGMDWWWWRTSRVIEDVDLLGNHIEVIDEFPAFSYVLGDNHPHVMAMPMVLLAIGLILNMFYQRHVASAPAASDDEAGESDGRSWMKRLAIVMPLGWAGLLLITIVVGSLIFLNTWDFPPYWLLFVVAALYVAARRAGATGHTGSVWRDSVLVAVAVGAVVLIGTIIIYLPYFLSAQSQAGGIVPNFFHPTRLPQFLLMFGSFLPALIALSILGWRQQRPSSGRIVLGAVVVFGLPLLFLCLSLLLAGSSGIGRDVLASVALPPGAESHAAVALARWRSNPWTFLLTGSMLALFGVLLWQRLDDGIRGAAEGDRSATFALLLAALGLLLVFAPEFVYLRDNFGTRMNTVFKFYYQAWLLFALAGAYGIVRGLSGWAVGRGSARWVVAALSVLSLVLVASTMIFLPAGVYSKTGGLRSEAPTFDALAYVAHQDPAEAAALSWIRASTAPDALILEGKGASYRADFSRVSAATGRPTLLGWDGHESQWRGKAYGEMAQGRSELLELVYRHGSTREIEAALEQWGIDYVFVGPSERAQYEITPQSEERLDWVMDRVFEAGSIRIYRRRG